MVGVVLEKPFVAVAESLELHAKRLLVELVALLHRVFEELALAFGDLAVRALGKRFAFRRGERKRQDQTENEGETFHARIFATSSTGQSAAVNVHPLAAHKVESWGAYHRSRSPDAREGVASFFEKRPPDFPMRVPSDLPDFFPWWDDKRFWNSPG